MEAYFEMYPEEKLFFVFEDGNVFFAKDKNLAEKHKRDTNKDYQLIHKSLVDTDGEAISEAIEKLQDSDCFSANKHLPDRNSEKNTPITKPYFVFKIISTHANGVIWKSPVSSAPAHSHRHGRC